MFVIVLSTNVHSLTDLQRLKAAMEQYRGVAAYSVDLGDVDKVLRVVCDKDISSDLSASLHGALIGCSVMDVFQNNNTVSCN